MADLTTVGVVLPVPAPHQQHLDRYRTDEGEPREAFLSRCVEAADRADDSTQDRIRRRYEGRIKTLGKRLEREREQEAEARAAALSQLRQLDALGGKLRSALTKHALCTGWPRKRSYPRR